METNELHRGRLIDHVQLVVADLDVSRRFYVAAFDALGIPMGGEGDGYFWADELFVSSRDSQASQGALTGRVHLAFQALSREAVERFHQAVLAACGRDNGAPGMRPYHPGYRDRAEGRADVSIPHRVAFHAALRLGQRTQARVEAVVFGSGREGRQD
jgi:catechol 2,3-dioxygenase-like lactoylglutathione lyase family enzyme